MSFYILSFLGMQEGNVIGTSMNLEFATFIKKLFTNGHLRYKAQ